MVEVIDPRRESAAEIWVSRLVAQRDLVQDVIFRLAQHLGKPADELGARIRRMTAVELGLFIDEVLPGLGNERAEATCRWILERAVAGDLFTAPGFAATLSNRLGERALVVLGDLIPRETCPVLLATCGPERPGATTLIEEIARALAHLVVAQPRLPTILAVEAADLAAYLSRGSESREKALIRSGVVPLKTLEEDANVRRLEIPDAGSIRIPSDDGATPEPADHFLESGSALSDPEESEIGDRSRSEAERFLFARLSALPATTGLFEQNSTLDIPFGPGRTMEVDLVSRSLGLVIEIDGFYHFQNEDAYRRDRRKDFLLQDRGYLVVRVLAEDVVRRLEDVLDQIVKAVASRRNHSNSPNRDVVL